MDGSAELPPQLRTALRAAAKGEDLSHKWLGPPYSKPPPTTPPPASRRTARAESQLASTRAALDEARVEAAALHERVRGQADELARVHASTSETTRTLKAQLVRCQAGLRASAERAQVAEDAREPLERRVAELSAQLLAEQQRVADMLVEMAAPKTPPTSAAKGLEWTGPTPKQARDELRVGRERVVRAEERASQLQAAAAAREGKLREALEAGRRKAHHAALALERAETKAAEAAERIAELESEKAAAEQAAHVRADAHSRAMADERARRREIEAEAESSAEASETALRQHGEWRELTAAAHAAEAAVRTELDAERAARTELAGALEAAHARLAAQDGELVGRRALCAKLEGELMRLKQGRGGGGESGMVTPTTGGGSSSARPFSSPVHDASAARRSKPPRMRF